jgi:hypothetical protein
MAALSTSLLFQKSFCHIARNREIHDFFQSANAPPSNVLHNFPLPKKESVGKDMLILPL